MDHIFEVSKHAIMISAFVLTMMLLIEYLNVQTMGAWEAELKKNKFRQYLLSIFLGVIPGCMGGFTVVSLYSHGVVSIGALTAAMIATSGDEAFVMFGMFPETALLLTVIMAVVALVVGIAVDYLSRFHKIKPAIDHSLEVHDHESCPCFSIDVIRKSWQNILFSRALLLIFFLLFLFGLFGEFIGPHQWNWAKITFTISGFFGLFVVATVPDHFLQEHIWTHIIKKHLLRIFLWTFAALFVTHLLEDFIDVQAWIQANIYWVLLVAALVGVVPESGPHLVFVTMFASGNIPFAILLANSISQDGHAMLPLLAVSKRNFLFVKFVNILVALFVGFLLLLVQ